MHSSPPLLEAPTESPGDGLASVHSVRLRVNGQDHEVEIPSWVTLLDLLRERLGLMGTKKGCDHGQCGACTVLADGQRINACLTLAVMQEGVDITTVEGLPALAGEGRTSAGLHPLQQAFIDHDAFQCGYCTPGQLCSAVGLMNEGGAKTADDVRERMSGNLCRCGAYPQIVQAVAQVAGIRVDAMRLSSPAPFTVQESQA
ncbi:(2Fe-2S)-binding protein [Acidovorax sp. SUPP2539]|uniref:(2Fe-2S)-binding protein n=1 Tax=Acidovorax sp. SUPP2539 TaxID=2920878 RepID=UPI0024E11D7B|nr:(2Fe-2S)-binding protein [Acidovorax sp. SUPP2539]